MNIVFDRRPEKLSQELTETLNQPFLSSGRIPITFTCFRIILS